MASHTAAPGQYPEQLVIMVTSETKARIVSDAKRHRLSKSEVARTYLDAGIAEADRLASADYEVRLSSAPAGSSRFNGARMTANVNTKGITLITE